MRREHWTSRFERRTNEAKGVVSGFCLAAAGVALAVGGNVWGVLIFAIGGAGAAWAWRW